MKGAPKQIFLSLDGYADHRSSRLINAETDKEEKSEDNKEGDDNVKENGAEVDDSSGNPAVTEHSGTPAMSVHNEDNVDKNSNSLEGDNNEENGTDAKLSEEPQATGNDSNMPIYLDLVS